MKLKHILLGAAFSAVTATSQAALIDINTYDIENARTSGFGGWSHTYDGTITSNGVVSNYSDGSGTLNDGQIGTGVNNTQLFLVNDDVSIDLFLGESSILSSLSLFSFVGSNGIPGNITGLNVTINGVTDFFSTTGFGLGSSSHTNAHELIDLSGSALDGLATDLVTLSGFTTVNPYATYFSISEVQVEGQSVSVSEPGSIALLALGLAGFGMSRKRQAA